MRPARHVSRLFGKGLDYWPHSIDGCG
jgi:hypothetical protein